MCVCVCVCVCVLLQLRSDRSVKRVDVEEGFINIYLDGVCSVTSVT